MTPNENEHIPVLLNEVLNGLKLRPGGIYVDCTFGRGGHSKAILQRLGIQGRLFVIDKDPAAIRYAQKLFSNDKRVTCVQTSFSNLEYELNKHQLSGIVDGVLLDLGVSSPQLDDGARGFSFLRDGELDMRMNQNSGISASEWLNHAKEKEIARVFHDFGEERFSHRIAAAIVRNRKTRRIERTGQLAAIIAEAVPFRERKKDPATRSFQAIRIFINNELDELRTVLQQINGVLKIGGRLVVISFHSLEDRIVKQYMLEQAKGDRFPADIPVMAAELTPKLKIIGKPIKPVQQEIRYNPRARSAVLRIGEKIAA